MQDKKQVVVDGIKFNRDLETGYYLSSREIKEKRVRLHRYIWSKHFGEIPKGHHVHHIDHDKSNNDISNLECLKEGKHNQHHAYDYAENNYNKLIENLDNNARPKASQWHGTKEGIEWHKEHYHNSLGSIEEVAFNCKQCGEEFHSKPNGKNIFCSNKCKSQYRRDSGVDDEERICKICNSQFTTNKYSKAQTCSRRCSGELRRGRNKESKD